MRVLVLMILVALCPAVAEASAAEWPADLLVGPHEVVTVEEVEFRREGREMAMPVRIRYPRPSEGRPGPFPLVVFSHGMGGFVNAFEKLSAHLASHGYVVIHPAHTDSIALRRRAGESAASLRREFTSKGVRMVDLPARVADCRWILAHISEIEAKIEQPGLIDAERTAMAGHSAGAMTTQALAGILFFAAGARPGLPLADGSDFDAYIIISGQGTTRPGLRERSWQGFLKPTLVFAGSVDTTPVSNETPQSRRHPFEHAPPGEKYLIYIDGATHGSYQGGSAPHADEKRIEALTAHATLAFLELHLKQNEAPRVWLNAASPEKFAGVKAEYRMK